MSKIELPVKVINADRVLSCTRLWLEVGNRRFKRLFEHGSPVCWLEDETQLLSKSETAELESIFKAFCLNCKIPYSEDMFGFFSQSV